MTITATAMMTTAAAAAIRRLAFLRTNEPALLRSLASTLSCKS